MEALAHIIPLIFTGSLAALVLALGLDATPDDVLYLLRRPRQLLRAVFAISVIVPVTAVIVVSILPLQLVTKAGVILMALAPVPPLVPGKDLQLGGRKSYVYGLYVAFAFLAIVIVPITVAILSRIYGTEVAIAPRVIARTVIGTVLVPLVVAMTCRALFPRFAAIAAPVFSKLSMLLLILACIPLFIGVWPAVRQLVGDGVVVAIIVIAVVAIVGGHLLGGPDHRDRAALAGAAATRHPGIAMMIANANFQDKRVTAVILLYLVVSLLVVAVYQVWLKREERRRAARMEPD